MSNNKLVGRWWKPMSVWWKYLLVLLFTADTIFTSVGDDEHWVYADGVKVGEGHYWKVEVRSKIKNTTQVIAIKVNNTGGYGALMGSLSDGSIVTDEKWKC